MARIDMMWLNDGIHGRADKTSRTYVKGDKVTGRTYAVTLRNPVYGKDFKNGQITQNNKFGALCMGVAAWYNLAKASNADAADKAQLEKFVKAVKSQHLYPTVRSLIIGKRYATVNEELSAVTITDGAYTKTVQITFNARPLVGGNDDPGFEGGSGSGSSENVTISLSAIGNGKVSIDGGTAGISKSKSVAPGTQVAILATPDTGATFTRWSDGDTNASRNVTVNAAMSLSATFSGGNSSGDGPSEG